MIQLQPLSCLIIQLSNVNLLNTHAGDVGGDWGIYYGSFPTDCYGYGGPFAAGGSASCYSSGSTHCCNCKCCYTSWWASYCFGANSTDPVNFP